MPIGYPWDFNYISVYTCALIFKGVVIHTYSSVQVYSAILMGKISIRHTHTYLCIGANIAKSTYVTHCACADPEVIKIHLHRQPLAISIDLHYKVFFYICHQRCDMQHNGSLKAN